MNKDNNQVSKLNLGALELKIDTLELFLVFFMNFCYAKRRITCGQIAVTLE
jgi:hypothetical protein